MSACTPELGLASRLRRRFPRTVGASLVAALLSALGTAWQELGAQAPATAFVNVEVVPMDSPRTLPDHSVLVEGGRITQVGPSAEVLIPQDADVIQGAGLFLVPGLADMHAHFTTDPSPDFLVTFLATGITTARNLNALPEHLEWKRRVQRGDLVGPTIFTSGPGIAGPPDPVLVWQFWAIQLMAILLCGLAIRAVAVRLAIRAWGPEAARRIGGRVIWVAGLAALSAAVISAKLVPLATFARLSIPQAYIVDAEARARAEVGRQAAAGYDLVKVYDYMRPNEYLAAIAEAREAGIYASGHLAVGVDAAAGAGIREIVHVDEFLDFHTVEPLGLREFKPVAFDYGRIAETVQALAQNQVAVTVNLTTDMNTVRFLEVGPDYFLGEDYRILRPEVVEELRRGRVLRWQPQTAWRRDQLAPFLFELTRQLHEGGVLLLAGTDASMDNGSLPHHIHDELQLMVSAGLSPFAALTTATVNPAIVAARMGDSDAFGMVSPGHRADLLLLKRNPLEDVSATEERVGVMARGQWYSQEDLDTRVGAFTASMVK